MFTNNGTLSLNSSIVCDILIVGGGGGGGYDGGGGGGGGQVLYYTNDNVSFKSGNAVTLTPGTYNINIGSGGLGKVLTTSRDEAIANNGTNGGTTTIINSSTLATILSAKGGGAGGSRNNVGNGGDVGGTGGVGHANEGTSPTSLNGGGTGGTNGSANIGGGGGGGGANINSLKNGEDSQSNRAGNGGAGVDINIIGVSSGYGGGGGGGSFGFPGGTATHGGGGGNVTLDGAAINGTPNTGGGGGSGGRDIGNPNGKNGGSGVVIIRFLKSTTKKELFNFITIDNTSYFKSFQYNTSTGYYSNTDRYILNGYYGDWIIIKIPYSIYLSKYRIYNTPAFIRRSPSLFKIYGSTDGSTYEEIIDASNDTTPLTALDYPSSYYEKNVNYFVKTYNYFGIVVNKIIGGNSDSHLLNISEFQIYGRDTTSSYIPRYLLFNSTTQNFTGTLTNSGTIINNGAINGNGTIAAFSFTQNGTPLNTLLDAKQPNLTASTILSGIGSNLSLINYATLSNLPNLSQYALATSLSSYVRTDGTTTITAPLNITSTTTANQLVITNTAASNYASIRIFNGTQNGYIGLGGTQITGTYQSNFFIESTNSIIFATGGANTATSPPKMILNATGNLGIGTTNPFFPLTVVGNAYISGNIGVGTTNPGSYKLNVSGDFNAASISSNGIPINFSSYVTTNQLYGKVERQYPPRLYDTSSYSLTSINGLNNVSTETISISSGEYGAGNYTIYTTDTQQNKKFLFNYVINDDNSGSWGTNYTATSGTYIGTTNSINSYYGDWIIIKLPSTLILSRIRIYPFLTTFSRNPSLWKCFGSNDGSVFTEITFASNDTIGLSSGDYSNGYYEKIIPELFTISYLYIAFVFNKLVGGDANSTSLAMVEFQVFCRDTSPSLLMITSLFNKNFLYYSTTGNDPNYLKLSTGGVVNNNLSVLGKIAIGTDNNQTSNLFIAGNANTAILGNVGIGTTETLTHKLNVAGNVNIDGGLAIFGSPAFFQSQDVENSNKINTFINFKEGGASNDWCYLRQIGGNDAYKLTFDFHDGNNDARFCIRTIQSFFSSADIIKEVFTVDNGDLTITGKLSANSGNHYFNGTVGIGTTNPQSSNLFIAGNANTAILGNLGIGTTDTNTYKLNVIGGNTNLGGRVDITGSINQTNSNQSNILMGNVGIGTTTPSSYNLNVSGSLNASSIYSNNNLIDFTSYLSTSSLSTSLTNNFTLSSNFTSNYVYNNLNVLDTGIQKIFPPKLYNSASVQSNITYLNQTPVYYENITLTTANIGYGSGTYDIYTSSIDTNNITFSGTATSNNVPNNSDYAYIIFTNNGSITLNTSIVCDILVVGGGGGGGVFGGGGGAGAVLFATNYTVPNGTHTITVGAGGAGGPVSSTSNGFNGSNSSFAINGGSTFIAVGGGGGGARNDTAYPAAKYGNPGNAGGSGGGGGHSDTATSPQTNIGGISNKNSYPGWNSYGNSGGIGKNADYAATGYGSGGGGGAGSIGSNAGTNLGGNGGTGIDMSSYFGTLVGHNGWFSGGGGGGSYGAGVNGFGNGGNGLFGGGGNAFSANGLANTGGGGGGGNFSGAGGYGGTGGSGVVIIRFLKSTAKKELFNYITNDNTSYFKSFQYDTAVNANNGYYLTTDRYILTGYFGDWIIIKMPYAIFLSKYRIYNTSPFIGRSPSLFKIYGSSNGSTYEEITTASNDTTALISSDYSLGYYEKIVDYFAKTYIYFGIVVKKIIGNNTNSHLLNINEFQIFGRETTPNYVPRYLLFDSTTQNFTGTLTNSGTITNNGIINGSGTIEAFSFTQNGTSLNSLLGSKQNTLTPSTTLNGIGSNLSLINYATLSNLPNLSQYLPIAGATLTAALNITSTTIDNQIIVTNTSTNRYASIRFFNGSQNGFIGIGCTQLTGTYQSNFFIQSTNSIIFAPGDTNTGTSPPKMMLNSIGNLGIGTANPILPLSVIGNAYVSGNLGIGTTNPSTSKLHIFEPTGTDALSNAGSLFIQHGNNGGVSSIVFPSATNINSDFGYIKYVDNVSSTSGNSYSNFNYFNSSSSETGALIIGCENEGTTTNGPDSVIINPIGNVAIIPKNNITYISGFVGIGTTNPGLYNLNISGSLNVSSLSSNTIPIDFKSFATSTTLTTASNTLQGNINTKQNILVSTCNLLGVGTNITELNATNITSGILSTAYGGTQWSYYNSNVSYIPSNGGNVITNSLICNYGNLNLIPNSSYKSYILLKHNTFNPSIGANHPNPECALLMTNASSGLQMPWGFYNGVVKYSNTSSPGNSLRYDIGNCEILNTIETKIGTNTFNPFISILYNGNTGIGTTNPGTYKLNITGNTNLNGSVDITGSLNQTNLNQSNIFMGNVGIGTTDTSTYNLNVAGTVNATDFRGIGTNITQLNYNNITINKPDLSVYTTSNVCKNIILYDTPNVSKKFGFLCSLSTSIYPNGGSTQYYKYDIDLTKYTTVANLPNNDPYRIFKINIFKSSCYFGTIINDVPDIISYEIYMSNKASAGNANETAGINICAVGNPINYKLDKVMPNNLFLMKDSSTDFNTLSILSSSILEVRCIISDLLN